jgi:predicted secreted protein
MIRFTPALLLAGALASLPALAQPTLSPPAGVLSLSASASIEVPNDVLRVVFSVTREGADAQAVQNALKQALDAALVEARKIARPDQVELQTGSFSLYPRYANPPPRPGTAPPAPQIAGWVGNTELVVHGKDTAAIAQLTGRITTMTIARVGYQLSKQAREKVEADAMAQAIAQWRAKAGALAQQFGFAGYAVREVSVATNEPSPGAPVPMLRMQARAADAAESLPTEAGKGEVNATVNGSVQMTR